MGESNEVALEIGDGLMALDERELQVWKQRLDRAKNVQSRLHPVWNQSLDLYRMRFFNKQGLWQPDDDEQMAVNFATTFIKRMLQATYARYPKMYVEARRPRYVPFAQSMQTVLNYYWEELDIKNEVLRAYRDALIFGLGWIELGWTDRYAEPPNPEPTPEEAPRQTIIDSLKALVRAKPPSAPPSASAQGELHQLVNEGAPFVRRRSPWHVYVPDALLRIGTLCRWEGGLLHSAIRGDRTPVRYHAILLPVELHREEVDHA